MVSRVSIVALLIMVVTALFAAPISRAALIREPHVDPNKIEKSLDPISLVIIYINVLKELSDLNLNESLSQISILKNASVPYDVRLIMVKLNELISELASLINNTVYELNNTEKYLEEKNLVAANESISKAALYLFKANKTLGELLEAWYEFKKHLSIYVAHEYRPRFLEYTVELELLFKRLDKLLNKLYALKQDLETKIEVSTIKSPNKINTTIMVYYCNHSIYPGGLLVLKGILISEDGVPLANRTLRMHVYVRDKRLIDMDVLTNSKGIFYINVTIPHFYYLWRAMRPGLVKFNSSIYIVYTPPLRDNYSGSYRILNITYYYYRSKLNVTGKTTAYVGSNLTFRVRIMPPKAAINRVLRILLDQENIANISLYIASSYRTIRIRLPSNISVGQHFINITLLSHGQFSPDSVRLPIIVQHIPIYVSINYPQTIVYPVQELRIDGSVLDYYGRPVVNASIIVGNERAFTDGKGLFNVSFPITSANIIGGLVTLNLTVKPIEPWYPVVNRTLRVNYVNIYAIIGIVSYIAATIIVAPAIVKTSIYKRSRESRRLEKKVNVIGDHKPSILGKEDMVSIKTLEKTPTKKQVNIVIDKSALHLIKIEYRLKKDIIIDKFLEMLFVLSKKYSEPLPSETLREYVTRIIKYMPNYIAEKIYIIIILIEKELYSKTGLNSNEREKLLKLIEEVIRYVYRV